MAHTTLKLRPGVDQNETPTLNEAGISSTNLIRFMFDRTGVALVQKLGGWTKFFGSTLPSIVRALWAWEDTNAQSHLAVGMQNVPTTSMSQLGVITNGVATNITPQFATDTIPPDFSTVTGSNVVTITDGTITSLTNYDTVYIENQVSIGGLVLFGLYQCHQLSSTAYNIYATDILGNPQPATGTVSNAGVVPVLSTTIGSTIVSVNLPNHGYSTEDTFPILTSTTLGGVTFYGNYIVTSVTDADNFTINGSHEATATTTGSVNGGDVTLLYSYGVGAIVVGSGYGAGGYGTGGYGTGTAVTPTLGTPIPATDWTMDNWGETLVVCPVNTTGFQPVYVWNPSSGSPFAACIPQSPPINDGIFVAMPQRQIVAWGSSFTGIQDPLLIRWCDVNNYTSWIASVTNEAGSFRIPKGSKIVGCIQGPQQGLIWTDLGLWSMQYIGPSLVYSFNEIGTGCGLIGRKAAASINGNVYWMGASQFFSLTPNGVDPVPCPVWDVIFQDLDTNHTDRIRVAVNSRFGEIMWFYPTKSNGGEVNAYVKYNVFLQVWDFGFMARSAWIDQSVLGPPIGADPNSLYIYQHETSTDADGAALNASFQTGYFSIADGDLQTYVDQWWPDMKFGYYGSSQNATIKFTFYVTDYPGDTPRVYGPYSVTRASQFITPRFRGRLVAMNIASDDVGSFWRLGGNRYRIQPDGKY